MPDENTKRKRGRPPLSEEEKARRKKEREVAKRNGRPTKAELAAKRAGNRPVGRPPGDKAIMDEYKARLLASPKSRLVLDTILDAALDNEHKNQSAAWKLLTERLMPLSYFQKDNNSPGRSSVSITISGVGGDTTIVGNDSDNDNYDNQNDDIVEGEYTISDV